MIIVTSILLLLFTVFFLVRYQWQVKGIRLIIVIGLGIIISHVIKILVSNTITFSDPASFPINTISSIAALMNISAFLILWNKEKKVNKSSYMYLLFALVLLFISW